MQRFSKTKTYTDKDGNKYSYMGKYRGYWNWLKFSDKNGLGGGWTTKSESEMLRLEFKELKNK